MKNIRLTILFCAAALAGMSQPYGQTYYPHTGAICSSGSPVSINTTGFIMAGYQPNLASVGNANFYIDKTGPGGIFAPAAAQPFSNEYKIFANASCTGAPPQVLSTKNISVIETNISGSPVGYYAIAGGYDGGSFFATLDGAGNPLVTQGFKFPNSSALPQTVKIIESSTPNQYFICGTFFNGSIYIMYVIKMSASGGVLGTQTYKSNLGSLHPYDMIFSPYGNEIVVVGSADSNLGTKAFFMRIDASNINNVLQCDYYGQGVNSTVDNFNSIAVASSPTGGQGFVIGGYTDQFAPNGGDIWMLKVNPTGGIIWNTVVNSAVDNSAKIVSAVTERFSSMYGYTYYGAVNSYLGMMVEKLDDNGNPFTSTFNPLDNVNEFFYNSTGVITIGPAALSFIDSGVSDIGIQVYGTDDITAGGNLYFVEATFNGHSGTGCGDYQGLSNPPNPGPNTTWNLGLAVNGGLTNCNNLSITSIGVTTTPYQHCSTPTIPPGGSNNRTTGIKNAGVAEAAFAVYPNPVSSKLQINYSAIGSKDVKIALYDYLGRLVQNIPAADAPGSAQSVSLDLSRLNLESGIYIIKASINGIESQQKIVYTKD